MQDERAGSDDRPVELVLRRLQLEVAHEHPGQRPAQEQAHGHDAGGGGEQAEAEAQLAASSSR